MHYGKYNWNFWEKKDYIIKLHFGNAVDLVRTWPLDDTTYPFGRYLH